MNGIRISLVVARGGGFPTVIITELPIDVENGSPNYFIGFGNCFKEPCSEFPKDFIGIYDRLIVIRAR